MIALAGSLAILTALAASVWLTVAGAIGGFQRRAIDLRRPATLLGGAAAASFLLLELGILTHDFSIAYIANNTATTTPVLFLFAAGWAALVSFMLAVAPEAEGHGIGSALITATEALARDLGAESITLHVFGRNRRARGVYERLGYDPELIRHFKILA